VSAARKTREHKGIYADMIRELLRSAGREDVDSRHVEAYMRVGHGELDGLSKAAFEFEADVAVMCIDMWGVKKAEDLARSFRL
jgi:hypothetical protein